MSLTEAPSLSMSHASLWQQLTPVLSHKKCPQNLLFIGARHVNLLAFANQLIGFLLCRAQTTACGVCAECRLLAAENHPDVWYLQAEARDKPIKIEQVRALQQQVYHTPQRAAYRFVVIDAVDRMNVAAANALLKVLEEPPAHVVFILLAEQIASIPKTILSRCQRYCAKTESVNLLAMGACYPKESRRHVLYLQMDTMLGELLQCLRGTLSPCVLAQRWSSSDSLEDLVWYLYLLVAQLIERHLVPQQSNLVFQDNMAQLLAYTNPIALFAQLDFLQELMQKINHTININASLALEAWLIRMLESCHH